ncbi:MAG: HEPN domain-containing protein [Nitrospirae bacterium]|nr:MAG: HEPN domain-containing protein [Nitrospirota bacterium]
MTNESLARSYLKKATDRLKVLDVLFAEQAYSGVVREAQELVEPALKGMLRAVGIEPPKLHDVGGLLVEHAGRFPVDIGGDLPELAAISRELRKERELAFYGDSDFIPTEEYTLHDAQRARQQAERVLQVARRVMLSDSNGSDTPSS